jgi:signal transduction histidine kinase
VGDIVRFTAEASHELRTPVSLMRTTAELALRHTRSPEEYRRALCDVASQAHHMSSLIDDLMVLARSDAGIETRTSTELDLRNALGEAVREIGPVAAERAVALTVDLPSAPVTLRGDEDSLRRALLILLENAIKYSKTGGHVRVGLEETGRGENRPRVARVSIRDAGIGLDESERSHLFDRFYRGARAREHAPEGTGLGLAIARTIVDRHGGSIVLEPGPGGGCEARLTLPAVTAQPG